MTESMSRSTSLIAAFAAAAACSAPAERVNTALDPSRSSQLGVFMKTYMNPPFSKISFLLFHEGEVDSEIDAGQLPTSANELVQAAERLSKWTDLPGESPESKQVFGEYAAALRTDARSLVDALRDQQQDTAVRVFESLHKKCDSCHHFFRYDDTASLKYPLHVADTR
jgi:cytochrome c556